jgi:hypothetical protein
VPLAVLLQLARSNICVVSELLAAAAAAAIIIIIADNYERAFADTLQVALSTRN